MTTAPPDFPTTDRTTIGRAPERGSSRRDVAYAILDEALVCHVGVSTDRGPVVIPTTFARIGDDLVIHGAPAATWLRSTSKGTPVCVTVTLIDGLVLARSTFHHSMNYRSVVVFGDAVPVTDRDEKAVALDAFVERMIPGRVAEVRPTTEEELRTTLVVRVPLAEASTKIRTGGANDDPADAGGPGWAGVVPLAATAGRAVVADDVAPEARTPPASVRAFVARHRGPASETETVVG